MDREAAVIRQDAYDALACGDLKNYAFLCNVLADRLDDRAEYARADARRRKAQRIRTPGILWPRMGRQEGLYPHQRQQAEIALSRPVGVLAGVPGTGKTHTAAAIIERVARSWGEGAIAVCAPTGKAAVRLTSALAGRGLSLRATTIHQLLEIGRNGHDGQGWGFRRNANRPLEQRFYFVDEISMLDTDLAASFCRALPVGAHVLMIGDPHQLPPVGHGAPLRDLIDSGRVPVGRLGEIRRNAGQIVEACKAIREGGKVEAGGNLWHLPTKHPADSIRLAWERFHEIASGRDNPTIRNLATDTQFIVATNKGPLGRVEVNKALQELYNPHGGRADDNPFRMWDKVICLRNGGYPLAEGAAVGTEAYFELMNNNHVYIANGEMGTVVANSDKSTTFAFANPARVVTIPNARRKADDEDGSPAGGAEDFALGYAVTCHKFQGSECPAVAILIDDSAGARQVCSREWLYTAVSRASQLCLLVGDIGVARMMPRRPQLHKRRTRLAELLREEPHNAAAPSP
jgi:exodeoxyribonuclease V alpha subunit